MHASKKGSGTAADISFAIAHDSTKASARLTPGGYVATGPAIIRNSVIRTWAEEVGAAQAAAWAGLKSLDRLGQPVDAGA